MVGGRRLVFVLEEVVRYEQGVVDVMPVAGDAWAEVIMPVAGGTWAEVMMSAVGDALLGLGAEGESRSMMVVEGVLEAGTKVAVRGESRLAQIERFLKKGAAGDGGKAQD